MCLKPMMRIDLSMKTYDFFDLVTYDPWSKTQTMHQNFESKSTAGEMSVTATQNKSYLLICVECQFWEKK